MKLWLLLLSSFVLLYEAGVLVWWRAVSAKHQQKMIGAIRAGLAPAEGTAKPTVLVEPLPSKPPLVARLIHSALGATGEYTVGGTGQLALMTLAAALVGFLVGWQFRGLIGIAAPILGAIGGAFLPRMYNKKRTVKRLGILEEQFPEALIAFPDRYARATRSRSRSNFFATKLSSL
jgi:Flp pilus assembly protein TadB